jgi:fermentation-respiration switch protein FrsA (DUF1100 family)
MKLMLTLGSLILGALVLAVCFGPGLQRQLMYPRPPAPAGEPRTPPGTQIAWLGPDANVEAWFLRPSEAEAPFPVVVFTHGNGELIDHWAAPFTEASDSGVGVLLVEYPGYGRSGGSPSQRSITRTMLAAHAWLLEQPGVDPNAIVAYGRSLGGAAACGLARERPLAALVLESTFTSTGALAQRMGFPASLVSDPFDNLATVSSLDIPTLVLHGERDEIIPVSHGEALAAAANTELVRMRCGHNDCPWMWRTVASFLARQGVLGAP